MGNWWLSKSGKNELLRLPEWLVLDLLWRHAQARDDYLKMVETVEDETEKERLESLWNDHPNVWRRPMKDPQIEADALQRKHNTAGVRTRKPKKKR